MNDRTNDDKDLDLPVAETPSGGGVSEDWLATALGLALLALALLGLIPGEVLW